MMYERSLDHLWERSWSVATPHPLTQRLAYKAQYGGRRQSQSHGPQYFSNTPITHDESDPSETIICELYIF